MDLDSVAYQKDDLGGGIRAALTELTNSPTIPQIFVGGQFIGGCTELFDAVKNGSFSDKLKKVGIEATIAPGFDPYSLLPGWIQPR